MNTFKDHTMLRRNILSLALPAAALAACSTVTNGGKTTYTLDTKKIDTDGSAIIAALSATLAAPSIALLLGPDMAIAQAALVAARAALAQFDALTGGSASVVVDTTQAAALILSLISNSQAILTLVQGVIVKVPGSLATTIGNYVAAVLTLLPLLQLSIGMAGVKATKPLMTEAEALRIATH